MSLDSRVAALERQLANLQQAYLQSQRNQVPVTGKTDESYNKIPQINDNTERIAENTTGLMETYEETLSNETDISDCRTAIEELYEMMEE